MIKTEYTRATLPQAYFPDNWTQVDSRQRELRNYMIGCFEYSWSIGGSVLTGFLASVIICLFVMYNLPSLKLITLTFPILTIVPSIVSPIVLRCYYKNKYKRIEPLARRDHHKLCLPEIRNIYLQESNPQKQPFENLIGTAIILS